MSDQQTPQPKRSLRHRLTQRLLDPTVHVAGLVSLHITAVTIIAWLEKIPFAQLIH